MNRGKQRGITLVMVLVFLVVITLIAMTGMASTRRQEQMAGAVMDRMVALAASEAAVREGSAASVSDAALGLPPPPVRNATDLVAHPVADGASVYSWRASGFDWFATPATKLTGGLLARVNRNPTYVVDQVGTGDIMVKADRDQVYRITARGEGGRRTSEVYTQNFRLVPN